MLAWTYGSFVILTQTLYECLRADWREAARCYSLYSKNNYIKKSEQKENSQYDRKGLGIDYLFL